jgi:hypothetical protein
MAKRSAARERARNKATPWKALAAIGAAVVVLVIAGVILFTKKSSVEGGRESRPATDSGSSKSEAAWRTLFDGSSLANWRGVDGEALPAGWGVSNGVIKNSGGEQYLITRDSFEDFELELEWKADLKGNGGVKFWIDPKRAKASVDDAMEMQIGDPVFDPAYGNNPTWIDSGALHGMFPAVKGLAVTGQWNTARLVVRGNKGEHFINGKLA